jgi:hypothetical protein
VDFPTPPFWFATAMTRDDLALRGRDLDLGWDLTGGSFTFVFGVGFAGEGLCTARVATTRGAFEEAGVADEALRLVTTAP